MVWMDHILFTHLPVDGQWGCFHLWAVVNIYEHGCANISLKPCFHFFRCLCRSGIAGSNGDSIFNFWTNRQALLHHVCTILYSHQHHPCVPISLANTTFCFLIVALARGVRQRSGPFIHVLSELYLTSETLRQQLPLMGHAAL